MQTKVTEREVKLTGYTENLAADDGEVDGGGVTESDPEDVGVREFGRWFDITVKWRIFMNCRGENGNRIAH